MTYLHTVTYESSCCLRKITKRGTKSIEGSGKANSRKLDRQIDRSLEHDSLPGTLPDSTRNLHTTLFGYKNMTNGEPPSALDMGGLYNFLVIPFDAPKPVRRHRDGSGEDMRNTRMGNI